MLVKLIMKVLKNLFGQNKKINASEIAYKDTNDNVDTLDDIISGLKGVLIYSDSTGSNSNITLSKNIDDAKFFFVTYRQEGYSEAVKTDVVIAKETKHQLSFLHRNESMLYEFLTYINISGTSLSVVSCTGLAVGANNAYGVSGTTIYITKIVAFY